MEWNTTTRMLEGLKGSGASPVWTVFRDSFYPAIVRFARKSGLPDALAEDAAQETMLVFVTAFRDGKYDKKQGRLRNWLFGIAKRVILDQRKKIPKEHLIIAQGDRTNDFWMNVPDDSSLEDLWDKQWQSVVLNKCLIQVRREFAPNVLKAFEMYGLQQQSAQHTAEKLNMTVNAVYIAKNRILTRLRKLQKEFEDI